MGVEMSTVTVLIVFSGVLAMLVAGFVVYSRGHSGLLSHRGGSVGDTPKPTEPDTQAGRI